MSPVNFAVHGKVLVLRVVNQDYTSYNGFHNPSVIGEVVKCPDWKPTHECGNGLHGWAWGIGRIGKEHAGNKIWQVYVTDPDTGIDLNGKGKWPELKLLYSGGQAECMKLLISGQIKYVKMNGSSAATSGEGSSAATSGDWSSAATSGDWSSAATSGDWSSAATSGDWSSAATSGYGSSAATSGKGSSAATSGEGSSAATSGYGSSAATSGYGSSAATSGKGSSAATSGEGSSAATSGYGSSAATSGYGSSAATSGESSPAVCAGLHCKAKSGPYGIIVLGYMENFILKYKSLIIGVGDGSDGLGKAHTWYKLGDSNEFEEVI